MDVTPISTAADGIVHVVDAVTYYSQDNLTTVGNADCTGELLAPVVYDDKEEGAIWYNDQQLNGFTFNADSKPLIDVTFTVDKAGTSTITNKIESLGKSTPEKLYRYVEGGEAKTEEQPHYWSTIDVTCPHPDEPTVAPTEPAGDKAIVHVSGQDGETETKEFNVGDTFYVYTTLNASQINDG
ncbi:hypothetical protein, partial [Ruminococcus sp.]|uniref:hypothetical protein n=1 Tax=Ruminococcus sp. TaxID=41978 RepID=UPI0038642B8A